MEPIAIVGFAFRFPQGAEDEASFWDMLQDGRNVMTEWPKERGNIDAFSRGQGQSTVKNRVSYIFFCPHQSAAVGKRPRGN